MHISPFVDVCKKKPSDPKEFSGDPTLGHDPKVENHRCRLFKLNLCFVFFVNYRSWSRGHKARGQGQGHKKNPRPRPRPRTAFPRTDTREAKDRNALGQEPRTQPQVFSKQNKKKIFKKVFQTISNL